MKQFNRYLALLLSLILLLAALGGCGKNNADAKPADSESLAESTEPTEAASKPVREDGEEFEATIMIEGMEETVKYRHIRNATAGFEMDFEYETFVRRSESDRERIIWGYDDPENPENYIEVSYCPDDAEAVADAVSKALSNDYELFRDTVILDGAGESIHIDASEVKGGGYTADVLQSVYILPADDGCRVAAIRYIPEGSDGFGKRLSYMVNTIAVTAPQGERKLSDDEAVSAVRRYCMIGNPDLERILNEEEFPVYWDILESSEDQIVVVFRSYTGAHNRYYIDPLSGKADVTQFVPGITDDEEPTDETLNVWDYVDWWRS